MIDNFSCGSRRAKVKSAMIGIVGERQGNAQKGVCALEARKPQLEMAKVLQQVLKGRKPTPHPPNPPPPKKKEFGANNFRSCSCKLSSLFPFQNQTGGMQKGVWANCLPKLFSVGVYWGVSFFVGGGGGRGFFPFKNQFSRSRAANRSM